MKKRTWIIILVILILLLVGIASFLYFNQNKQIESDNIEAPKQIVSSGNIGDKTGEDTNLFIEENKKCEEEFLQVDFSIWNFDKEYFGTFYSPILEKCMVYGQEISDYTMVLKDELSGYQGDDVVELKERDFSIRYLDEYKKGVLTYGNGAHYRSHQTYRPFDFNDFNRGGYVRTFCSKKSEYTPELKNTGYDYECDEDSLDLRMERLKEVRELQGNI